MEAPIQRTDSSENDTDVMACGDKYRQPWNGGQDFQYSTNTEVGTLQRPRGISRLPKRSRFLSSHQDFF